MNKTQKEKYLRYCYKQLKEMNKRDSKWITPEYNEPLHKIITESLKLLFGETVLDLFYTLVYEGSINFIDIPIVKNINEFIDYLNKMNMWKEPKGEAK